MYISYGHNFSIGSNIGISILTKWYIWKHQKSDHFYWITCKKFSKLRHWLWYWPLRKDFYPSAFSKKHEHYEILCMSKTLFQVVFSVWMLLLWLVYMHFPIENQYIHMNRENKQQKYLWNRSFHFESRGISKNLIPITMQKDSLNIMKPWSLQNTWKISVMKRFFITNAVKVMKGNEKLEHTNVSWQETTSFTFSWLHSFIHILCQVKYSVLQLFFLFVLSVHMNVLILNWKLHTNKSQ